MRHITRFEWPYPVSLAFPLLGLAGLVVWWPVSLWRWPALVGALAGLAGWTLLEYVLHRFVLHRIEPFRTWHLAHHADPSGPIRVPVAFSLGLLLAVLGVPVLLLGADGMAGPLSAGLLLGQVVQESVHVRLHAPADAGAGLARLCAHHAYHHQCDAERAFGTLTLFWDRCLGTAPPAR
ncbi:sterol desaturase family protein [Thauera sp.]|uniref:sterol desaturase family protein n=1 Tax=Thauera sp. TaxID=1905334 RepID=UPI00258FE62A|nr:sterol desaturase family protein [Thauera sp.]HRJ25077.1 sterol desaturase family protein [Thauera sp.]HRK11820.1 sterol desaturase family protein [Thauera sp.]